jgi:hypothetical protein
MKPPTLMVARHRGTEFSNPFTSTGESDATLLDLRDEAAMRWVRKLTPV